MKPFNELDQSVPAPEFGAGFYFVVTLQDELDLEKWCDAKLTSVREAGGGAMLSALGNWPWLSLVLTQARTAEVCELVSMLLRNSKGEKANLDLASTIWSRASIAEKIQIAILAGREGMTAEECQARWDKEVAEGAIPPVMRAEDS